MPTKPAAFHSYTAHKIDAQRYEDGQRNPPPEEVPVTEVPAPEPQA